MATTEIFNDNFEKGLRKFKKQVQKEGLIQEMRDRQYFMKKSEKKKRAMAAAKSRWARQVRESRPPKT